jgi:succinoglycan biosynthesis protein ExoM
MNASAPPADHISVCVCTYRRNEMLQRLLRNLALQTTGGHFDYSVVVVDNDLAGGARETVARARAETAREMQYAVEAEHTIPAARNHAVRLARGNYVAIIDDDEFPSPDWLLRLYEGIRTFDVDGALGPVFPFFGDRAPGWLVRSGLCELPAWRTGTVLRWNQTRTGNVLLKKAVFDAHGLAFDARFRTGGSDQAFFRAAMARGCHFVGVAEGPVYETVPPERWTYSYWVRRALVNGFNARRYATDGMSRGRQSALTIKSLAGALAYGLALPVCACLGRHRFVPCLVKGSYHLSRACASFGIELWKKRDF